MNNLMENMSVFQRLGFMIFGTIVSIAFTMQLLMSMPGEAKLFPGRLSVEDAVTAAQFLNSKGYTFEYRDGFIYVPSADKDSIILDIGCNDISLDGEDPFAYLEEADLSGPGGKQRTTRHLHAVELNLANIIESYKIVQKAAVSIVESDSDSPFIFVGEETVKATVQVKLQVGKKLDASHVQAIATIVANSVKGVQAKDVSISDTFGRVYSMSEQQNVGLVEALGEAKRD